MPPGQQQQQQGGGDNSLAVLWILIAVFVALGVIWYVFHAALVAAFFKIKLIEIEILSLFTSGLLPLKAAILNTSPAAYGAVPFETIGAVSTQVGEYLRYPVLIIIGTFAGLICVSHAVLRYRKIYSMESFTHEEAVNWPAIDPIVKLNLINVPLDEGPWAMAMTPMQFAKKYKLLKVERTVPNEPQALLRARMTATLLRGEAHRMLVLQCGRYWTGPQNLPPHMIALLAVFVAKSAGDREGANQMLTQYNLSAGKGKLNFSGSRELLRKHINEKRAIKVMQSHAFIFSMMASMLELARKDGVLASAEFLWLKPVDRQLWYMLNCVGRWTPYVEVCGPFAHWIAEKRLGRAIFVPMVDQAVNALEGAIQEVLYKENDETTVK